MAGSDKQGAQAQDPAQERGGTAFGSLRLHAQQPDDERAEVYQVVAPVDLVRSRLEQSQGLEDAGDVWLGTEAEF